MTKEIEKEGPRGFAVLIQQIQDGELHTEISESIQKLNGALDVYVRTYESAAKGSVTLTLTMVASPNGTVAVVGDVKTKLPPAKKRGQVFWLTKGNNLSPENPRQTKLPLREVPAPAPARDLPTDLLAPPRSV